MSCNWRSLANGPLISGKQRLKTWLHSTMKQKRFSNLTIVNSHTYEKTDKLSQIDIANKFTDRINKFRIFKDSDIQ